MTDRRKNNVSVIINILLFSAAFFIQYNDSLDLSIYNANPMLPLALLTMFSMFNSEMTASLAGMIAGIFVDSAASTPSGFHTILFFLIGLAVSLATHYLFNNNERAAIALCSISGTVYFLSRFLMEFAFCGDLYTIFGYLMRFALPSVIYTVVISIPLYFLQRQLSKR